MTMPASALPLRRSFAARSRGSSKASSRLKPLITTSDTLSARPNRQTLTSMSTATST